MRHFFPKNIVEASIWCVKCHKDTPHAIADGRPLHCKVCQSKPILPSEEPKDDGQTELFDGSQEVA